MSFNPYIMEFIIGLLASIPDDSDDVSYLRALSLFQPNNFGDTYSGYTTTIQNLLQFQLVVQYLSLGLFFRQIAAFCSQQSS